ncbi:MAG TPA: hypothetical protein VES92_07080, partial [Nitrospiraceae bacterium]|nr:hypothetical protein [Nitrospiraceae bacterium]
WRLSDDTQYITRQVEHRTHPVLAALSAAGAAMLPHVSRALFPSKFRSILFVIEVLEGSPYQRKSPFHRM